MQSRLARPDRNSAMAAANQEALEKIWLRRPYTRSQSRQAGPLGMQSGDGTRMQKGGKQAGNGLGVDVVIEESHVSYNSPKKPRDSPQKASARPNRQSLDWQEDFANISGTTILPPESEPDAELDPLLMIDALPDLDKTASDLLNSVVRSDQNPVRAVNAAKQLGDPRNRMFQRRRSNLLREAENFGHQTYIDVNLVNRFIKSAVQNKVAADATMWSLDPILHRANCALLALEVLVAGFGNSPEDTINVLESNFPAHFLGTQLDASLEAATFDLALEIRTQYLVAQLEMHQNDDYFNPVAILESVFYDEIMPDEEFAKSDLLPLRGFAFGPFEDENGRLPERFRNAANNRINDIRLDLEDQEDGSPNVAALRSTYRWQKFKLRTMEWIQRRDNAITQELERQRDTEDIGKESPGESGHHASFDGATASPFSGRGSTWSRYSQ
ncbi:hypothetical protein PHISP_02113 [Aspergillus sp. HF37]|nr:hypothetical protein PHISP_02113 [Aspergillus sp. HF37]